MHTVLFIIWMLMKFFALGAGIGAGIVGLVWLIRRADRLELDRMRGADPETATRRVIHMQDQLASRRRAEGAR